MLSGDGGDELFWGYAERFASVAEAAPDFRSPPWLRRGRWAAAKHLGLGSGYWQLGYPTVGDWYRAKQSHLEEDSLHQLFPDLPAWPATFPLFDYRGHDRDETAQWCRWNEFTGRMASILDKVDRGSMYASLEVRVPLLDREVVEVASRVAWDSCLDLDRRLGKLPLRHALRRHVHHQTVAKRGFTVPMGRWLRGPLRSLVEERVVERDELLGIPVDRRGARALFRSFLDGKDCAWGIWLLLSLALWEEHHLRGRGSAAIAAVGGR
jgi:asparagine synthase (glutamine-hydrolysing)